MNPLRSDLKVKVLVLLYVLIHVGLVGIQVWLDQPRSVENWMYTVGKAFGFMGITGLAMQVVLSSRIKWLESGVGLDRIFRWHKFNAKFATVLLLIHPGLVFYGPLMRAGIGLGRLKDLITPGIFAGQLALILIIVTVATTLYATKIKLSYERWRWVHRIAYFVIISGFIHALAVGSNVRPGKVLFYWLVLLVGLVVYSVGYRYLWRPYRYKKNIYTVVDVKNETSNVRTLILAPPSGQKLIYASGQFAFTRIFSKGLSSEEHHFTFSSSPIDEHISFSIKESGDYTSQLGIVKPGDAVSVEGPYGVFSNQGMKGPFLFIAGGIGITPLRSMLRTMKLQNNTEKTILLYANRTFDDIAFYEELEQLQRENDWFRVVHVLSGEERDGFYYGYVTKEVIQKESNVANCSPSTVSCFLCGPPSMMEAVEKVLRDMGISPRNIFTEKFALR